MDTARILFPNHKTIFLASYKPLVWHGRIYTYIRAEVNRAHKPMVSGASGCRQGCQLSDVEWTTELVGKDVYMKRNTLSKYDN